MSLLNWHSMLRSATPRRNADCVVGHVTAHILTRLNTAYGARSVPGYSQTAFTPVHSIPYASLAGAHMRDSPLVTRPHTNTKRHNASRANLKHLGKMVRSLVQDDGNYDVDDVVRELNRHDYAETVVRNMPDEVDVVHCDCGHFAESHDVEDDGHGLVVCDSCFMDGEYLYPEDDNRLYHRDDLVWSDNHGGYFTYNVDRVENEEDEEDEENDRDGIFSWGADSTAVLNDPEIESTTSGDFTIGMEFECEPRGYDSRRELVDHIVEEFPGEVMCKEDGSLSPSGIELVMAPMTLESTKATWRRVEFPPGTRAWNAGSCGTHVHIDARAFTRLTLAKFVAFWNSRENAALITLVAGRHPSTSPQAQQYAALVDMDPSSIIRTMKKADINVNRYRTVNLTTMGRATCERLGLPYASGHHANYNTVELRIFRASLKPERTLAQIEMAHASVVFAREGSCSGMNEVEFRKWLATRGQRYPHLRSYLGITRPHKLSKDEPAPVEAEAV